MGRLSEPMTSEEFEKQTARIIRVLEEQDASVVWDEKIPDPDNPSQARQIDIAIRRDGFLTLAECRLHARRQDVKWVEELYGRRASLEANAVIGVSSSGFTSGAVRKAKRLGVILRDLRYLTNAELVTWGRGTRLWVEYTQFDAATVYVVTNLSQGMGILTKKLFRTSTGDDWPVTTIFRALADKVRDGELQEGQASLQIFSTDLYVRGVAIDEIVLRCHWRKVRRQIALPVVYAYGPSDSGEKASGAFVEKAIDSETEIYHATKGVRPVIDLSVVEPMEKSIFQGIVMDFGQPLAVEAFELLGGSEHLLTAIPFTVRFVRKGSAKYSSLFQHEAQLLSLPG